MTEPLHPQLLTAFLAGKSCSAIALAFNLSVEEVLAWFESDLTQSTLRRLEALQLQQARIVSFSVLPHAAGSLTNTCESADNPALRTRAASNLVRLGLKFTTPSRNANPPSPSEGVAAGFDSPADLNTQTSRNSEAPSLREGVGGRECIPSGARAASPTSHPTQQQIKNHSRSSRSASSATSTASAPSDPSVPSDSSVQSASPASLSRRTLACETLRAEFAALRTGSPNALRSSSRIRASNQIPDRAPTLNPLPTFVTPLLSRRESRIASLRSSAGAIASHDAFPALNRAPPRNSHAPPPINSAA